jgi:hypothetical protein
LVKYEINLFKKTALTIIDFCKHETKHGLVTKLIFSNFFLALFEEKNTSITGSVTLAGCLAGYPVSGLTGYLAGQSGIRLVTGYQKRPDIRCIPTHECRRYFFNLLIILIRSWLYFA